MAQAHVSVPGVINLDLRAARAQKIGVLIVTVLPFLGLVAAIVTLWGNGLSIVDAGIFLFMYAFTCLGVTVGYHRFLTHGSFKANGPVRATLAIAGSMAIEGSVNSWVAAHRRHHAFSDREGDPHSPHLDEGKGIVGIVRGLWHSHMGWLFSPESTEIERWAPDLLKDPVVNRVNRLFALWVVTSLAIPPAVGFAVTQSWQGAVTAFLWGSLARVLVLHHVTWSINSICHFYGKQPYETTDHSTNNWALSLISFGESWHNNHHAFPTSARHGLGRGQIDVSAAVITVMQKFGWARDVKDVSEKQLHSKESIPA